MESDTLKRNEWIKKMWCMNIMLSEISQLPKSKCGMIPLTHGI